jgi:hypothetical protein
VRTPLPTACRIAPASSVPGRAIAAAAPVGRPGWPLAPSEIPSLFSESQHTGQAPFKLPGDSSSARRCCYAPQAIHALQAREALRRGSPSRSGSPSRQAAEALLPRARSTQWLDTCSYTHARPPQLNVRQLGCLHYQVSVALLLRATPWQARDSEDVEAIGTCAADCCQQPALCGYVALQCCCAPPARESESACATRSTPTPGPHRPHKRAAVARPQTAPASRRRRRRGPGAGALRAPTPAGPHRPPFSESATYATAFMIRLEPPHFLYISYFLCIFAFSIYWILYIAGAQRAHAR